MSACETTTAPRRQCAKCPWKKGVDPLQIPGGYSAKKHAALKNTIADASSHLGSSVVRMACHETPEGAEKPCVGWLVNQLGPGNNLALRMQVVAGRLDFDVETVGEQHERFEDTLPKRRRGSKGRAS